MQAMQALVITSTQLRDMLTEAAKLRAALAVKELRADLHQTPDDATLQKLRSYLAEPASLADPQDHRAHSELIRRVQQTAKGKPKSTAFMKFQREPCFTRPSPGYGRRREWTFADIRLAWDAYSGKR